MKCFVFFIFLFFGAFYGSEAFAETKLVTAADPKAILEVAKGYGRASLGKDSQGDPHIEGKMGGLLYQIVFHYCTQGANCKSIQFFAGWRKTQKEVPLDVINKWNSERLFAYSVRDKEGQIRLLMDVFFPYGMTEELLDSYFSVWKILMKEFHATVMEKFS